MAKIIVIDDEPGMRLVTQRILEASGHQVLVFADGRGAVAHIAAQPVDLLITDIFMPDMEGLETIREVRALRPALPIIAVSGFTFADRDYLDMAEKLGAAASLKKPFHTDQLLDLVSRLLRGDRE